MTGIYGYIEDINFFEVNTKYISSSALKKAVFFTSAQHEWKFWYFHHTRWNIFGFCRKKSKFSFYFILNGIKESIT